MIPANRLSTSGGFGALQAEALPDRRDLAGGARGAAGPSPEGLDEFERSLAETSPVEVLPGSLEPASVASLRGGELAQEAGTWMDTLDAAADRAEFWLGRGPGPQARLALDWLACLACSLDGGGPGPALEHDGASQALRHLRPELREQLGALASASGVSLRTLLGAAWRVPAEQLARAEGLAGQREPGAVVAELLASACPASTGVAKEAA